MMPTLYIIGGPNGVGKTTFADEYLPDEIKKLEFINADLIARDRKRLAEIQTEGEFQL